MQEKKKRRSLRKNTSDKEVKCIACLHLYHTLRPDMKICNCGLWHYDKELGIWELELPFAEDSEESLASVEL